MSHPILSAQSILSLARAMSEYISLRDLVVYSIINSHLRYRKFVIDDDENILIHTGCRWIATIF